jgi:acyl-lipid omega-3 desaturase
VYGQTVTDIVFNSYYRHKSFSNNDFINGIVGHVTHSPLLVPFYPWAYSHKQHHRFHNHETKDMSHPWMSSEQYGDVNPIVRALALVSFF